MSKIIEPGAEELLTVLAEECAEVVHAVTKSLRHGLFSCHPTTIECNADQLSKEIGQVLALVQTLHVAGLISTEVVKLSRTRKYEALIKYLHTPEAKRIVSIVQHNGETQI